MDPRQPAPRVNHPYPLPPHHERHQRRIIHRQHRREHPRDYHRVPADPHPLEQVQAEREADPAFAQALRDHQLRRARRVRVHRVRQREREVEVRRPVDQRDAREVPHPVQAQVRCHAVEDQARGGDQHGREEHAEAHFGFADVGVTLGEVCGEAVGGEGEGDGEGVADDVAEGDEAGVLLEEKESVVCLWGVMWEGQREARLTGAQL